MKKFFMRLWNLIWFETTKTNPPPGYVVFQHFSSALWHWQRLTTGYVSLYGSEYKMQSIADSWDQYRWENKYPLIHELHYT